eukprot:276290_1
MKQVVPLLLAAGAGAGGLLLVHKSGLLGECTRNAGISGVNRAVCILNADGGSKVSGRVVFEAQNNKTKITAEVIGLTPGKHGFHIHKLGDLSEGCKSAKGHYNPYNKNHGGPNIEERHVGDLGNIIANNKGIATVELLDELVQLNGVNSII